MGIQDGYYFIVNSLPGNIFLTCDAPTGKAIIENPSTLVDWLKNSSNRTFRVENVENGAFLIYNEVYQLALALQSPLGKKFVLKPLKRDDKRQWWTTKADGALVSFIQNGPAIALQASGTTLTGANHKSGLLQQQWIFYLINDASSSTTDDKEVKANRDWLREMLRFFTSNIPGISVAIGTYPYERSHITHPNAAFIEAIRWQNGLEG